MGLRLRTQLPVLLKTAMVPRNLLEELVEAVKKEEIYRFNKIEAKL